MSPEIIYVPDASVDESFDAEIRALLTACFKKPEDHVFKERRYFREPYPNRWVIRDKQGSLTAHIGVHEKRVQTDDAIFAIGGICEVCVHPESRGQGYVRLMLENIHGWMRENGFVFSVLFGSPSVYRSSGYREVGNLFHGGGSDVWKPVKAMARELTDVSWPDVDVHLPGPKF